MFTTREKKIAIVSVGDLNNISMISMYTTQLEDQNIDYDIIFINRYNRIPIGIYKGEYKYINEPLEMGSKRLTKFIIFMKYKNFVCHELTKGSYDFVIVWNENTAVLLSRFLGKKFPHRYCVNIRDLLPKFSLRFLMLRSSMKYACFTTFPSPILPKELAKNDLTIMINEDTVLSRVLSTKTELNKMLPLTITFLGQASKNPSEFGILMRLFANDKRFTIQFFGNGFPKLKEQMDIMASNIIVGEAFPYNKTVEYLEKTDILNTFYGFNLHDELVGALGVKDAYGPLFYIPEILNYDTYWGNLCESMGIGLMLDKYEGFPDKLYNWYMNLEEVSFFNSCAEVKEKMRKLSQSFYTTCEQYMFHKSRSDENLQETKSKVN